MHTAVVLGVKRRSVLIIKLRAATVSTHPVALRKRFHADTAFHQLLALWARASAISTLHACEEEPECNDNAGDDVRQIESVKDSLERPRPARDRAESVHALTFAILLRAERPRH